MYSLAKAIFIAQTTYEFKTCFAAPSVAIAAGTLQGSTCDTTPLAVFYKSIPYAQPPTGPLRFAPPKPYNQKYPNDTINASSAPPSCIQFGKAFAEGSPTSEDCLYLNIWTPANTTKHSSLPVRVWIYGGDNNAGGISDPLYDGCNVPSTDALMVSVNYRVGPLGFMSLGSAGVGGNHGIQDILLGLEWVQQNIASFGGDPNKVLLHGQSAGAFNTFAIATLPQAPRLIKAAILQSGGGRDSILNDTAEAIGASFATNLGCGVADLACLQNKSVMDLKETYHNLPMLNRMRLPGLALGNITTPDFQPHVDGKIIPNQPSQQGVQVPSIFGSTTMEGTIFALGQFSSSGPSNVSETDYQTFLTENFGPAVPSIQQAYPISAFQSTSYPAFHAISKVLTDSAFFCPTHRGLNTAASKNIPVWTYLFAHDPSCDWLPKQTREIVELVGATHSAEIPFAFGNDVDIPQPNGSCQFTSEEKGISAFINPAWTAMAAGQRPTNDSMIWPAYGNSRASMGINILNKTVPGYVNYTICQLWDSIDASLVALADRNSANSTFHTTNASENHTGAPMGIPKNSSATDKASSILERAPLVCIVTLDVILWLLAVF